MSPLTALARRWKLATLLIVVGTGAGIGIAHATPTTYTGEARVAVGSQSLDARVVAGYSTAATQLASDISRYVNDRQAQNDLEPVLGTQADAVDRISASPIAGSSVIVVEVDASDRAAATKGAQTIAQQLVDQVNASYTSADELLQRYTDMSAQVQAAQQEVVNAQTAVTLAQGPRGSADALASAQSLLEQKNTALDSLKVQQESLESQYKSATTSTSAASGLTIVRQAQVSRTSLDSALQQDGLAGAGAGGLLALLLANHLERRNRRRKDTVVLDTDRAITGLAEDRSTSAQASASPSPHRV